MTTEATIDHPAGTEPPEAAGMPGKRSRGRPRSDATRQGILEAAVELMGSTPYREITVEGIAQRAKVGKQSIYRWWPSKADLVLEAYTER